MVSRQSVARVLVMTLGASIVILMMFPLAYWVISLEDVTDQRGLTPNLEWETLPDQFLVDPDYDRSKCLVFFNGSSIVYRPRQLDIEELEKHVATGLRLYRFDEPGEGESHDFTVRYDALAKLMPGIDPWATTAFVYFDKNSNQHALHLPHCISKLDEAEIVNLRSELLQILLNDLASDDQP